MAVIEIFKMGEITEIEAYKQLLEVTENILNELSPEDEILHKYYTLKKSIFNKVKPSLSQSLNNKILEAYKSISKHMMECIGEFESEIEGEMNKTNFLKRNTKLRKDVEREIKVLGEEVGMIGDLNKNVKLIVKEEVNALRYLGQEMEGKIENMSLMIEVHRKMHEIILEASEKEVKTSQKEAEYNKRLNEMEEVVDQINDVNRFIESYNVTEKKAKRFESVRRNLAKVLFDQ